MGNRKSCFHPWKKLQQRNNPDFLCLPSLLCLRGGEMNYTLSLKRETKLFIIQTLNSLYQFPLLIHHLCLKGDNSLLVWPTLSCTAVIGWVHLFKYEVWCQEDNSLEYINPIFQYKPHQKIFGPHLSVLLFNPHLEVEWRETCHFLSTA